MRVAYSKKLIPHLYIFLAGNNLYGNDIIKELNRVKNTEQRSAYILMERIFPPAQKNYLLKAGAPVELSDVLCELGIYGVFIG